MIRPPVRSRAIALALGLVAACGPSEEQRDRDRVLAGLARLEDAPKTDHAARAELAQALLALDLTTERAKRARDACGRAYLHMAEGNQLAIALQRELGDAQVKSDPKDLGERLLRAEKLIADSEAELATCANARIELVGTPR